MTYNNHIENETPLARILDLARWAPSGDNTQPWRFEIIDDTHLVIRGHDTREWCVYDLEGRASQIAVGTLLENIAIAATAEGLRTNFSRRKGTPETHPVIDTTFEKDASIQHDPLQKFITMRTTQRRSLSSRALTDLRKQALETAISPKYRVIWLEGSKKKWQVARILFQNAHIRLTIPEAYRVHREIIEWDARFSEDRIPDQALGIIDPLTLRIMRWAMQSWERVVFLNRYLAGTLLPRIQLDLLPALRCAGHFVLVAVEEPKNIDDYLSAGRALQRFWLTATRLGLLLQPEMTPLIFSRYVRENITFTQQAHALNNAQHLSQNLDALIGPENNRHAVFMGRLGSGRTPVSRSTRLPLEQLLKAREQGTDKQ